MTSLEFMGEHPFLTFFLAAIFADMVVKLVRGRKPRKVKPIMVMTGKDDS
jgi:hypothetical protein